MQTKYQIFNSFFRWSGLNLVWIGSNGQAKYQARDGGRARREDDRNCDKSDQSS